jgi:adenylosuccinate synthase
MPDLEAQAVRARGNEFGAVTGRPRRCGWLDLFVLRYAKMLNDIDSLVVTKLDVFDEQAEIKICTGYRLRGQRIEEMPPDADMLALVEPEYRTLPGWRKPTPGIRDVRELPIAARDYLNFISDQLQLEIGLISTGPERDATIIPRGTKLASWM